MFEPQAGNSGKAPWHLWAIGIIGLLWSAIGAFDYAMTEMKNEAYMKAFTPAQLEYFYSLPAWVVACWAVGVWGGVVGCLLIVLRKRAAAPVLLASLVGATLTFIHNIVLSNGLEVMGGGTSAVVFPVIILVIALGLWWYAKTMAKRGVLA